ncbi:response regulator [Sorangium sp. So ce726]|uniref:response regulator n=1 Tax=Sorangium sp. So ce726 TaxID=3133319 RepID=UPI003F5D82E5
MNEEHQDAAWGPSRCHPGTVLIVDDDPGVVDALTLLLSDEGYRVVTASNGRAALSYLAQHEAPGIILLDMMMPTMDGYAFRVEQRRHPALAAIPVVVMTAGAQSARVDEMCATGFLSKPVDVDALLALLKEHCER